MSAIFLPFPAVNNNNNNKAGITNKVCASAPVWAAKVGFMKWDHAGVADKH